MKTSLRPEIASKNVERLSAEALAKEDRARKSSAFTLIELLVVIAIIAILAGLLFPALKGAREAAKKSKTQVMISQMGLALKAYYNEYGYWPSIQTVPTSDAELTAAQLQRLYQVLQGSNLWLDATATVGGNPRGIVFLEMKSSDFGMVDNTTYLKTTSGGTTNIVNPWGNGYRVAFDYDGNNQVAAGAITNTTGGFGIYTVGGSANTWYGYSWK